MNTENITDIANADLFLKEDEEIVTKLGIMAAKIAFYNFQWRYLALVVYLTAQYSEAVDTFLSHYNQSVAVKLGKFRPLHRVTIPQFVLFGEEASDLTDYLRWLIENKYDNTAKFLLICHSTDYKECDENHIFKTLAEINVVNVIFLRVSDIENEPEPFSYHMILPEKCKNSDPEKLDIRNDCPYDSCFELLFPEKFKDLHKCPIIVSTFEQPPFMYLHNGTGEPTGGDGDMLKIVTSALNATLVIKPPAEGDDWGHYENNNWTGSMGDVFNDRAHLSVCSLPLTTHKYGNFQISFIYNTMDIVWVAQLPALKPVWEKLLLPLNFRARVAVLLIFICVILISGFLKMNTLRNVRKILKIGYPKQSLFFYSWAIFLGIPILTMPSKRGLLSIVYSWIWFCFIIRSCYQAALISSLKKRVYQDNYKNFQEVLNKKIEYGGQGSYREYFVDEKNIYDNWKQLDLDESNLMLNKISNSASDFVLAYNKEMVIEHLMDYNGSRRLQMIRRKILNSPTVMYMKKFSPLASPLNTALSRAVEAGYAQVWHSRFIRQRKHLFEHSQVHGPQALTLEHFGGCIVIIVIGWVISTIFFVLEVFCGRVEEDS
ncbi:uncharacterized protein [Epargyreus clarus]|uniref:uncharacterized protein n=1 Tax=Epargyreus clarus TaxID=520877 RepID=UPI003C2C3255